MTKIKQLRLRCFFDVTIAEDNIGRVVFELFNDVCPKTCENFKALCTGERGDGKFTGKPLHYKNVSFHRVVKNFMIQSGDFSQGNGKGGESIYGGTFEDETFELKHQEPYLLSMANRGKNTNGSQFFITLAPAPHLDGVHVVFGHVISGQDVIDNIANQAVDKHSKPLVDIRIANCGELIPQIKPKESKKKNKSKSDNEESDESSDDSSASDSSSGSDSESDSTSEGEIDRISKKKNGNENSKDSKNDNVAIPISDLPNAPKIYSNIKADEIPEVPPNRFLARSFKPKEQDNDDREDREDKRREGKEYVRKFSYSKSGRKIKGRGFIRYRTPSPEDNRFSSRFRRSETPPHWKSAQSKLKTFKEAISQSSKDRSRENSRNRHRNDDRSWRNRRSRSRSRERFHNRSSRRDSSQRDHSLNRRSSRSQESRSPRRERKHSESSSPVAAKIKEQKENLNENSATSGKHDRDLTTHDRNSSRNKHDREKNSFSKNTDKSTSKRSRDDSD